MDYLPYLLALAIGVIAGLRALTAPAAIAWAAYLQCGGFTLAATPLAFMGSIWAVGAFTLLASARAGRRPIALDPQPQGADAVRRPAGDGRRSPARRSARRISMLVPGLVAGIVGAVIGTYGGAAFRAGAGQELRPRSARRPDRGCDRDRRRPAHRLRHPASVTARAFDAIIVGAGQAGPPLAGRLTAAGMKVALDRAPSGRRHLRQYGLHADQDPGRPRLCRASGAAGGRLWRADRRPDRLRHRQGARPGDQGDAGQPRQAHRAGWRRWRASPSSAARRGSRGRTGSASARSC